MTRNLRSLSYVQRWKGYVTQSKAYEIIAREATVCVCGHMYWWHRDAGCLCPRSTTQWGCACPKFQLKESV